MTADGAWIAWAVDALKPDGDEPWQASVSSMIADAVRDIRDPTIVDAGCGRGSILLRKAQINGGIKIGVDIDPDAAANKDVDRVVFANLDAIPLNDGCADLIISSYVLEHLEDPAKTFREFARLLKPGGTLIVWASNKWNYAMMLSSVTPTWFHNWVRRLAYPTVGKDNCPTYYRANTSFALRKLVTTSGFDPNIALLYGAAAYRYWGFSKILMTIASLGSRLVSATPLRCLKCIMVAKATKPMDR